MEGHIERASIENIRVGDTASCQFVVTDQDVQTFSQLSKDNNPLHMDVAFAKQSGFPGRVAHGMLSLSSISRLIGTELPGPGSLWISQDVQFPQPVSPGDTLMAQVTVKQVSSAAMVVVLTTEVHNVDTDVVVLRGTAKVRIPTPNPAA